MKTRSNPLDVFYSVEFYRREEYAVKAAQVIAIMSPIDFADKWEKEKEWAANKPNRIVAVRYIDRTNLEHTVIYDLENGQRETIRKKERHL